MCRGAGSVRWSASDGRFSHEESIDRSAWTTNEWLGAARTTIQLSEVVRLYDLKYGILEHNEDMLKPVPASREPSPSSADQEPWGDDRILSGLLAGERSAAGAMYDRLRPVIDRTLMRILRSRGGDFDDLVQSTFERVLRSIAEDRFEARSSLKTWASAIASHVALDAIRARSRARDRHLELPADDLLASGGQTEQRLESIAELARLHEILSQMKVELSETLLLHDVLGYHIHEIAQMRHATVPATQSRLLRARKELKRRARASIARRSHA